MPIGLHLDQGRPSSPSSALHWGETSPAAAAPLPPLSWCPATTHSTLLCLCLESGRCGEASAGACPGGFPWTGGCPGGRTRSVGFPAAKNRPSPTGPVMGLTTLHHHLLHLPTTTPSMHTSTPPLDHSPLFLKPTTPLFPLIPPTPLSTAKPPPQRRTQLWGRHRLIGSIDRSKDRKREHR